MSLTTVPIETTCRVVRVDIDCEGRYSSAGVTPHREMRVLARYGGTRPRFVEVEVDDGLLVTLPYEFAASVQVQTS